MSSTVRRHLEESERQLALHYLALSVGDHVAAEIAMAAAHRAASKAKRAGRA